MKKPDLQAAIKEILPFISLDEPVAIDEIVHEISERHGFSNVSWVVAELKRLGYKTCRVDSRNEWLDGKPAPLLPENVGSHMPLRRREKTRNGRPVGAIVPPPDIELGFTTKLMGVSVGRRK